MKFLSVLRILKNDIDEFQKKEATTQGTKEYEYEPSPERVIPPVTSESSWWPYWPNWLSVTTPEREDTQVANLVSSESDNYYSFLTSPEWYTNQLQSGVKAAWDTPYIFIHYLVPEKAYYEKTWKYLYDMCSNPENASYLNTIVLLARVTVYLTLELSTLELATFCIAMGKITWNVTKMYNDGYAMNDIAIEVIPSLAYRIYMYCRGESNALKPGETVDVSSMDVRKFMSYLGAMVFPPLPDTREKEIRASVDKLVDDYLPNVSKTDKKFVLDSLTRLVKFLALLKPRGELKTSADDIGSEL